MVEAGEKETELGVEETKVVEETGLGEGVEDTKVVEAGENEVKLGADVEGVEVV